MTFPVYDGTYTTQVTTSSDHAKVTRVEFDKVQNFWCGNFHLDSVVYFDVGVRVADGAAIVCHQEWDTVGAGLYFPDFAKLVLKRRDKCKKNYFWEAWHNLINIKKYTRNINKLIQIMWKEC